MARYKCRQPNRRPTPRASSSSMTTRGFRNATEHGLTRFGHDVRLAADGVTALRLLRSDPVEIMLLDVRLPEMDGPHIVSEALYIDPDLVVLMLSGDGTATTASRCMQLGATDYITKPVELTELLAAVDRGLRRRHTQLENRRIHRWLRDELALKHREVLEQRNRLETVTLATLETLVNAMEARDPYLAGHSARVAAWSATLASELGLADTDIDEVRDAGRLHDLGMIATSESILQKQGPLSESEFELVKRHASIGSDILAPLAHLGRIINYVRWHHERIDGTGYPDSLQGEQIPVGARIIGAIEIYDALTTRRAYREIIAPEQAIDIIRTDAGKTVGEDVSEALARVVQRREALIFLGGRLRTRTPHRKARSAGALRAR